MESEDYSQLKKLVKFLETDSKGIRQGALKDIVSLLVSKTKLSNNDVRTVGREIAGVSHQRPTVVIQKTAKTTTSKKKKDVDPEILKLREKHPGWKTDGEGSAYATEVKALRKAQKDKK